MTGRTPSVVCIGGGPAGLTAAYLLEKNGVRATVLEKDPLYVGGISRTVTYKGFAFDIGGHRFFSKSDEVNELWTELLGDQMLERPRKSRVYYNRQLFEYPIRAADVLPKLGLTEAMRCVMSYLKARVSPTPHPRTFEEWVTNRFGRRLFEIFFRTYTEKVWGMQCSEISADWAAQRIQGLSLSKAIWHAVLPRRRARPNQATIKTLVNSFRYPRRGPGMLWEEAARRVRDMGGTLELGQRVTSIQWNECDASWSVVTRSADGGERHLCCDHVVSSMPLRELVAAIKPQPTPETVRAAQQLAYRDFLTVALIVKNREGFDDNWIYIHDPAVKVGRIQNFRSWSPDMIPDPTLNCYGLEYFCFEGDGLWSSSNAALLDLAKKELVSLGLASNEDIVDGTIVRQPKAYPVYDEGYQDRVAIIRTELEASYPTLHLVGRNGMHKYNNQDHAMMTAMLTAKNILLGRRAFNVWSVNQDAEYLEAGEAGKTVSTLPQYAGTSADGRMVPARA